MHKFYVLIHSLILTTTPSLLVYPQDRAFIIQQAYTQEKLYGGFNLTYDDILHLLHDIESEKIDAYSEEELDRISHFLAFLSQQGMLPGDYAANAVLENDIAALLESEQSYWDYASASDFLYDYTFFPIDVRLNPAIEAHGRRMVQERKKKQTQHKEEKRHRHHKKSIFTKIKDFIKKHKKVIIIGAAIVVAVAVVVVAVAAAPAASSAAAAGVASAASAASASPKKKNEQEPPADTPLLQEAVDVQVYSFKENLFNENYFDQPQKLSLEENGRVLGSLFANDSYRKLEQQISMQPTLAQEVNSLGISSYLSTDTSPNLGHLEIDRRFSTDYTPYFATSIESDFTPLAYQMRGESALAAGYYDQAICDFERAITLDPTNPDPYLNRGLAHFHMGQFDRSREDFHAYEIVAQAQPLLTQPQGSVMDFRLGFMTGLSEGIYDSGKNLLLFVADTVTHPIHTVVQVWESLVMLTQLTKSGEWGAIAEVLVPEARQLIKEWDMLSDKERGEKAGYLFGKYGTDITLPLVAGKALQKLKAIKEFSAACNGLATAERTLLTESIVRAESIEAMESLKATQTTITLGEELGFTAREMAELKQVGQLEQTVKNTCDHLTLPKKESIKLFEDAAITLKPYQGKYMQESQIKELIQSTGIPTFAKPKGIPENYRIKLSDKPGGIKYVHPTDEGTYIRIMPGKPHSKNICQQKPYVNQRINGKSIDKDGNVVLNKSEASHIPLEEFIYREIGKN